MPAEASIALLAVLLLATQEGQVPFPFGKQVPLYLCRLVIAASSLLCSWAGEMNAHFCSWLQKAWLVSSSAHGCQNICEGKEAILVKRQECPQKKPTWQQSTGEAPGVPSKAFLAQVTCKNNLKCSSSLCPVTPLVITGAMERPLRFLGKTNSPDNSAAR